MPDLTDDLRNSLAEDKMAVEWQVEALSQTKLVLGCSIGRSNAVKRIVVVGEGGIEFIYPDRGTKALNLPRGQKLLGDQYVLLATNNPVERMDLQDYSITKKVVTAPASCCELHSIEIDPSGSFALAAYLLFEDNTLAEVHKIDSSGGVTSLECLGEICSVDVAMSSDGPALSFDGEKVMFLTANNELLPCVIDSDDGSIDLQA